MNDTRTRPQGLSLPGALLTLLFSLMIVLSWWGAYTGYEPAHDQVSDEQTLEKLLADNPQLAGGIAIPTGVYVKSLQFEGPTSAKLTGYVWQRYDFEARRELPPDQRGVCLPESISGDVSTAPAYTKWYDASGAEWDPRDREKRRATGDRLGNEQDVEVFQQPEENRELTLVQGWLFEVVLRQPFDYGDFPFDTQDVWMRLWPREFDSKKVVLVPDFTAYENTDPGVPFGLDQDVALNGWRIEESYFGYRDHHYDTDFGIERFDTDLAVNSSELYFSVILQREFLNPFVQDLLPLSVILALLFGLILTIGRSNQEDGSLGFSFAGTLGTAAALFFVVVLGHTHLRGETGGSGFVYLEWAYVITYCTIGAVSLLAYVAASGFGSRALPQLHASGYRAAKVAYWPTLSLLGLALTVWRLPVFGGGERQEAVDSAPHATPAPEPSSLDTIWIVLLLITVAVVVLFLLLEIRRIARQTDKLAIAVDRLEKKVGDPRPVEPVEPEPEAGGPIDTFTG